ncbi:MAG: flagellar motor stator protein MotA [Ignavibacteria bacterium]|jgi:chemotaxis protein MotA|nr:flagellar motor stator protein MotA [Ignavibacteria bacterium]MCU7499352.1 flagellar motor stator protein MotA [Ignavibacteria bacterium]MCU7518946.1 flagellar motor stator protein MotA [Ignavibacteria bacterium]MCU7525819.1 flagellar motor stator protein MotA [Ignavibacteria bacterium]
MFVIIGFVVVLVSVLVGFTVAGGQIPLLIQPAEFLVIGGAALGSVLITAPLALIKKIIAAIPSAISFKGYSKEDYLELLKSFNDLFLVAQRDGLIAIEKHIEKPEESDILSRNKRFINDKFAKSYFCDTMKVMLSGGVPPHEIEALLDTEIETYEMEEKPVAGVLSKTGDALPGLGIVAAVLGIIVTMGAISDGAETVGHHVASALVGTFLGVLMAYGFVGPLASNIEHNLEHKIRYLETIKACIVAYAKGNPPIIAVEIARRTIFTDERPSFSELENYIRGKKE